METEEGGREEGGFEADGADVCGGRRGGGGGAGRVGTVYRLKRGKGLWESIFEERFESLSATGRQRERKGLGRATSAGHGRWRTRFARNNSSIE